MDFATYQSLIEQNKHHNDDAVVARFYDRSVKTSQLDKQGLPIFKTVCYCEIHIKDNTTEVFDQPADKEKIERFPIEYARYKLSKKQVENGRPLEQFAFLSVSEIDSCKYRGIFTIEALAELSKEHANDLGLSAECEMARKFINAGKQFKQTIDVSETIKQYQKRITELEAEITILKKPKIKRNRK